MGIVNIVSRSDWGARPPKSRTLTTAKEIFLHHSVGSGVRDKDGDGDKGDDYQKDMQTFHMDVRGWSDIAYNFSIDPDGLEIYEGRGWGVRPGSQKNYNTGTWSVVVMGDFSSQTPSAALLARIAELVRYGQDLGHLPRNAVLQGHRDAPNQSTTCPGSKLYAQLGTINNLIKEEQVTQEQFNAIIAAINAVPLSTWTVKPGSGTVSTWGVLTSILTQVGALDELSDAELQAIAVAVADEQAERLAN